MHIYIIFWPEQRWLLSLVQGAKFILKIIKINSQQSFDLDDAKDFVKGVILPNNPRIYSTMKRNILACFRTKDGILSREEKMRQKKAKQTQEREQIFSRAAKTVLALPKSTN